DFGAPPVSSRTNYRDAVSYLHGRSELVAVAYRRGLQWRRCLRQSEGGIGLTAARIAAVEHASDLREMTGVRGLRWRTRCLAGVRTSGQNKGERKPAAPSG